MRNSEEAEFAEKIRQLTALLPLLVYHTYDSRRSPAGFPDLVVVGRAVLWRELKTATGKVTPAQAAWLSQLREAGQDAAVWRPAQLGNGQIWAELTTAAGRTQRA